MPSTAPRVAGKAAGKGAGKGPTKVARKRTVTRTRTAATQPEHQAPEEMVTAMAHLLERALALLDRLDGILPVAPMPTDWSARAYRWRKRGGAGYLQSIGRPASIEFTDLIEVDRQKAIILRNTRQFVAGHPANNVLLTGARGTGKSSLIKACLARFARAGLRIIEVDRQDLVDLADIVALVETRPERYIIFCDDLSFEEGDAGYKALKVALDGSLAGPAENVLIYATSNRRHLMPEQMRENLSYTHDENGEIHPGEGVEEKISLSERFGLWVSFYPFRQDEYLAIVAHWLDRLGVARREIEAARGAALQFALERGSRSGRVAWQFARAHAGERSLSRKR